MPIDVEKFLSVLMNLMSSDVITQSLQASTIHEAISNATTSFALIVTAEIGDKSQLVCMALATRHRALPILLGAVLAFSFLNTLAVVFGALLAHWLPDYLLASIVACLFAGFGIHSLLAKADDDEETYVEKSNYGIFLSTFMLITFAELGDKTQIAVIALSSTALPYAIWLGATLALATTSALGILAGRTLLQKVPLALLHKFSACFFLILSGFAGYKAYWSYVQQLA